MTAISYYFEELKGMKTNRIKGNCNVSYIDAVNDLKYQNNTYLARTLRLHEKLLNRDCAHNFVYLGTEVTSDNFRASMRSKPQLQKYCHIFKKKK